MNLAISNSGPAIQTSRRLPSSPSPATLTADRFERSHRSEANTARMLFGAIGGAIAGMAVGRSGNAAVASAAGLGSAAVTVSTTAPIFKQSIEDGLNGSILNDLAVTCGTVAAGGFLVSSAAIGGAGLAYAASVAIPGAAPVVGGIIGAALGAFYAK